MWKRDGEFPSQLRAHVLRRGSIAQACSGTGINRQQFNKYLAGQITPSARNLRKICSYLGVTEAQLMQDDLTGSAPGAFAFPATESTIVVEAGEAEQQEHILDHQGGDSPAPAANVLPNGCYDCYFPLDASSRTLVRWLLTVRTGQNGQAFTFRTAIRQPCGKLLERSRYGGAVLPGPSEAYLIGPANMPLHQPGVFAVRTVPVTGRKYFSGLALTRRTDGPLAVTVALHFRGGHCSSGQAVAGAGMLSLDDPSLDPVIARMMSTPSAGANWIQPASGKNLRPQARPGSAVGPFALAAPRPPV